MYEWYQEWLVCLKKKPWEYKTSRKMYYVNLKHKHESVTWRAIGSKVRDDEWKWKWQMIQWGRNTQIQRESTFSTTVTTSIWFAKVDPPESGSSSSTGTVSLQRFKLQGKRSDVDNTNDWFTHGSVLCFTFCAEHQIVGMFNGLIQNYDIHYSTIIIRFL